MITCKKSTTTSVKVKGAIVVNGNLIDEETGENIITILKETYGDVPFDLSTTVKMDDELGGDES